MSAVERTNAVLQLHPDDPVAIARRDLEIGDEFVSAERRVVVRDPVARGHKVALVDLAEGSSVRKYGQPIGVATHPIAAGEHVHDHNLVSSSRGGASSTSSPPRSKPKSSTSGTRTTSSSTAR